MILGIIGLVLGGFVIGWMAHSLISINYKERWLTLSNLSIGSDYKLKLEPVKDLTGFLSDGVIYRIYGPDGSKIDVPFSLTSKVLKSTTPSFNDYLPAYKQRAEALREAMEAENDE